MHKLMKYVCDEMKELEKLYDEKQGLSMDEMKYLDMLAHTKKNMLKAEEMSEYSNDDGMSRRMSRRSYGDNSYADSSFSDRESYARGRMNAPRDSMGRYSGARGYSRRDEDKAVEVLDDLRGIVRDLPKDAQFEVERIIKKHEDVYA